MTNAETPTFFINTSDHLAYEPLKRTLAAADMWRLQKYT
jgi:hypothetical protein